MDGALSDIAKMSGFVVPARPEAALVFGIASAERAMSSWLKRLHPGSRGEQLQVIAANRFPSILSNLSAGTFIYLEDMIGIVNLLQNYQGTLEELGVVCYLVRWDQTDAKTSRRGTKVYGKQIPFVMPFHLTALQRSMKRILDIVISVAALALFSPLMLLIAVVVKADSSGPIIFRQRRLGLLGKEFRIAKFRSLKSMDDGEQITQVTRNDVRLTGFGIWLRQSSFDELPQFFNVLQGTMSVVGPRPHAVADDHYYGGKIVLYDLRKRVKPGITGWAQINGAAGEIRTLEDMTRRVDLDLDYIYRWSLLLDIRICFMTCMRGFFRRDAY